MDDHGPGTSTRTVKVAIAPQAWSEAPIGLIKKDSKVREEEEEEEEFT